MISPTRFRYYSLRSYTEPNARCPVCMQQVYFYQSPFGGRVFFDELGGDWPKHPCTDRSASFTGSRRSTSAQRIGISAPTTSASLRWQPLVITRVESHRIACYAKLRVIIKGEELELWTDRYQVEEGHPHFFRDNENGSYSVETISVENGGTVTKISFTVYRRQLDFEATRSKQKTVQVIRGPLRISTPLKKIKHKHKHPPKAAKPTVLAVKTAPPKRSNTAIGLAFERANNNIQINRGNSRQIF